MKRVAAVVLLSAGCALAAAQARLCVAGDVRQPVCHEAADLQALPPQAQAVSFSTSRGPQTHRWTGPRVWPLLERAGLAEFETLDRIVVASGADGYTAVFSLGELHPRGGDLQSIVALAGEGNPSVRMTAPGDAKGGRYVFSLARLEVRAPAASSLGDVPTPAQPGVLWIRAAGKTQRLDLAALRALPAGGSASAGAPAGTGLWTILASAGFAPHHSAGGLRSYVTATGAAGRRTVFAAGELDPDFGARSAYVAQRADGTLQLVVPNDRSQARWIDGLQSLEVVQLPNQGETR